MCIAFSSSNVHPRTGTVAYQALEWSIVGLQNIPCIQSSKSWRVSIRQFEESSLRA
jgi:hypothetical protein